MATAEVEPKVELAYEQEVRYAIVMYGGVSLAVYLNGITQELLHLVRATAPGPEGASGPLVAGADLQGTEKVYRKLGQLLGPAQEWLGLAQLKDTSPLRTRFMVDVLSGTSAGGINAIFLAKALANGQSLEKLKELWRTQADIGTLLNDEGSVQGDETLRTRSPLSLLNSRRMYRLLLDAFESMRPAPFGTRESPSPLVDELDLYVTTTDLRGVPVALPLSDSVVNELRHRHVFHLRYAGEQARGQHVNDFTGAEDAFLAFAARCTSAFPFAFEPMLLSDLQPVLYPGRAEAFDADCARWERFFRTRLLPAEAGDGARAGQGQDIRHRVYSDGGLLDNKPFSFATDTILQRHSRRLVDRRLLYLEPVPEHPEQQPPADGKPDAFDTAARALFAVRGYESIRADLEQVLDRNWRLRQLARVQQGLERDIQAHPQRASAPAPSPSGLAEEARSSRAQRAEEFARKSLDQLVGELGVSFGAYHRLKMAVLTEDLATLVARVAGFDETGGEAKAIHHLVELWIGDRYAPTPGGGKESETRFLLEFDLSYRLRRLLFLRGLIRDLYRLDGRSLELLNMAGADMKMEDLLRSDSLEGLPLRRSLDRIGDEVEAVFVSLRALNEVLRLPRQAAWSDVPALGRYPLKLGDLGGTVEGLRAAVAATALGSSELLGMFSSDRASKAAAREALARLAPKLDAIADVLRGVLSAAFHAASGACYAAIAPAGESRTERAARSCLLHFYELYDEYDLITYPLRYGTDLWAADQVSVARISPEDAPSLIDERKPHGRRKLAGNRLANFAAFVDQLWRRNDMLWGRLDGAERLIRTLLPPEHPDFATLRDEALGEILSEEIHAADRDELCRLLAQAVWRAGAAPQTADLAGLLGREFGEKVDHRVEAVLRYGLTQPALLEYFRSSYEVNRAASAGQAMSAISRAVRVFGRMLEGTADGAGKARGLAAWIARLGRAGWWFVEIATPGSLAHVQAGHVWALIVVLVLLVYVVGGGVFHVPQAGVFGRDALLALGALLVLWTGARTWLASGAGALAKVATAVAFGLMLFGLWKGVQAFVGAGRWLPAWARTADFDLFLAVPLAAAAAAVFVYVGAAMKEKNEAAKAMPEDRPRGEARAARPGPASARPRAAGRVDEPAKVS